MSSGAHGPSRSLTNSDIAAMCFYSAARAVRDTVNDLTGYNDQLAAEAAARAEAEAQKLQAEQEEAQRQAQIQSGKSAIDASFSIFNDDFYKNYADAYSGYYIPELEQQYEDARGKLASSLARSGMSGSSTGAKLAADLQAAYDKQQRSISSSALDVANQLQQQVYDQKNSLYSLNETATDPSLARTNAQLLATSLASPATYTPLGDVFSAAIDPIVAASAAAQQSSRGFNLGTYTSPLATNVSTIVR